VALPRPIAARKTGNPARKDPKRRHVDGVQPWMRVQNQKPGFKYAWISGSQEQMAIALAKGYEAVRLGDGETLPGGATVKPGEQMTLKNELTLMRISDERWLEIEQYGEDGTRGQSWTDEMSAKVFKKTGELDTVRGQHGQEYFVTEQDVQTGVESMEGA
jgi:hypothetical protein